MKRKISVVLIVALLVSLIAIPVLQSPDQVVAAAAPDNDFLDRLYNAYIQKYGDPTNGDDANLNYRLDKIEYLLPIYEDIEYKINHGEGMNFRSIAILEDDSPETYLGEAVTGSGAAVTRSGEGRPVYEIRHGDASGTSVIIWSQMHGTESTGTRAMMAIFRFLLGELDDELNPADLAMAQALRDTISELNIHFIPMINPDAANNWRRYTMKNMSNRHPYLFVSGGNSFPVADPGQTDLNRDAWTMETNEAKLLWRAFANFKRSDGESQPVFGFTLHDQGSTGVGGYDTPGTISMLTAGANGPKYFNDARYTATQVIQQMDAQQIQVERPEMVSRYTDDWGSVYFGDSYVMMGTGMILIETGHTQLDPEKVTLRRTNFKAVLRGLWEMAGNYKTVDPVDWAPPVEYNQKSHTASVIPKPPSKSGIYDVLLRNVTAPNGTVYNLGINRQLNVIQYDMTPGSTTLDDAKEHRSQWYYTSAFSGQGSEKPFNDNLGGNSSWSTPGAKPVIPYVTFNNGHADSRYSTPVDLGTGVANPIRYWGPVGYPTNSLGMTMGPTWPAVPTNINAPPVIGSNLVIGDSLYFGYEDLDCGGLYIVPAKVAGRNAGIIEFETPGTPAPAYADVNAITLDEAWEILKAGACAVRVTNAVDDPVLGPDCYNLPLVVLVGDSAQPATINHDNNSDRNNFILADKITDEAKYAVIGGYLIDLSQPAEYPTWGLRTYDPVTNRTSAVATQDAPWDIDAYEGHFHNIYTR